MTENQFHQNFRYVSQVVRQNRLMRAHRDPQGIIEI